MVIGASALAGIYVAENFDDPFLARNLQIYWQRWHMTLTAYLRDLVFTPLSKSLARILGPANIVHAIALSIITIFLMIGLWHGVAANFILFGLLQGLGVVTVHYYTLSLKRWLGRDGYARYMANPWIRGASTLLTFSYTCVGLFVFANPLPQMIEILRYTR